MEAAAAAERAAQVREVNCILATEPSLRELQSRLQLAYIMRAREEQRQEAVVLAAQSVREEAASDTAYEQARVEAVAREARTHEAKLAQYHAGRRVLLVQLEETRAAVVARAHAEAQHERTIVEAAMRRCAEEDAAHAHARNVSREATRREIDSFREERATAVAAAQAREAEEEARCAIYAEERATRERAAVAAAVEEKRTRDAAYAAVVAQGSSDRAAIEEQEELRWLLVEAEAERLRAIDEAARATSTARSKREMLAANEEQQRCVRARVKGPITGYLVHRKTPGPSQGHLALQLLPLVLTQLHPPAPLHALCACSTRATQAAEAAEREAALIEAFLAKCAADEANEARARIARAEARSRYMSEVRAAADECVATAAAARIAELADREAARARDEFRAAVIREARHQMLREHAAVLRGHLPRGVILCQADVELLKSFANAEGRLEEGGMERAQEAYDASAARNE